MQSSVIIIGGGVSGIVQARWLLEFSESCSITIIEKESDYGGVWDVKRSNGVMECTICNVSRFSTELLGHAWPPNAPAYPHHTSVLDYIRSYAKKYISARVNVLFNCTVKKICQINSTSYCVIYHAKNDTNDSSISASHVVIANGHADIPNYPAGIYPQDKCGSISHACGYKSYKKLQLINKKVLVVGLSFSAVDVAADLSKGNFVTLIFAAC